MDLVTLEYFWDDMADPARFHLCIFIRTFLDIIRRMYNDRMIFFYFKIAVRDTQKQSILVP